MRRTCELFEFVSDRSILQKYYATRISHRKVKQYNITETNNKIMIIMVGTMHIFKLSFIINISIVDTVVAIISYINLEWSKFWSNIQYDVKTHSTNKSNS